MKKIIIFSAVVIVIFAALAVVTNMKQSQQVEGNPFGKDSLDPATISQLNDPNYQNIILPETLVGALNEGETKTIYYYSPTCPACTQVSPVIVPLANEVDVNMQLFNLLEFETGWSTFQVQVTPTIVHYTNGQEVSRIEGMATDEEYRQWFEATKE
ncbi:thioredoxin family protein [Bacillus sp. FJAT-45350]|uniref:thioredoxin family protein n=1 Tax=Bacillus sp. FJAT-45350 TaxID=2011014 RepID=UPI000BB7179D|nr:thioredoxin family protein [Bacillus sp. FJAT-45350]